MTYTLIECFPDGRARVMFTELSQDDAITAFNTYVEFLYGEYTTDEEVERVVVVEGNLATPPGGTIVYEWRPCEGITWPPAGTTPLHGKWSRPDEPTAYTRRN